MANFLIFLRNFGTLYKVLDWNDDVNCDITSDSTDKIIGDVKFFVELNLIFLFVQKENGRTPI